MHARRLPHWASAHDLDGERWIYLGTERLTPGHTALVYPLPASFGDEVHLALRLFQDQWKAEARKLGLVDRVLEERARVLAESAARDAARIDRRCGTARNGKGGRVQAWSMTRLSWS